MALFRLEWVVVFETGGQRVEDDKDPGGDEATFDGGPRVDKGAPGGGGHGATEEAVAHVHSIFSARSGGASRIA